MAQEISKTQIDRLGKRLKLGKVEDDLRLLEQYRHSFRAAHEFVYKELREKLLLEPTKRRTKTTQSIVDKLLRGSIKLTQIQDIAGCRIVAKDVVDQNKIVDQLKALFTDHKIIDRREKPSHGYRAVHVIVFINSKTVEVQVRTELQDLWAELSEKCADTFGQTIKYGAGNEKVLAILESLSILIQWNEDRITEISTILGWDFWSRNEQEASNWNNLSVNKEKLTAERIELLKTLRDKIADVAKLKEKK
jgi:putative GTP pyrophosphokinase